MQPIKHARQPPGSIDYFAQQPNTATTTSPTQANNTLKYDVELNVCTSSISRHPDWKLTAKPFLTP
jgi:hypothetical protein